MKTVQSVYTVKLKVKKEELIEGKWLPYQVVSQKLQDYETKNNLAYKSLRAKLYNSRTCNKYNMDEKYGLPCVNIEEPMKGTASLQLIFEKE
jgi:hypothetical protein